MLVGMKFPLWPVLGLLCLVSPTSGRAALTTANWVPATSPLILVEGRCLAVTNTGSLKMAYPGVALHLRVQGSDLALRVTASSEQVYFDVSVDGAAPVRLHCQPGAGEYPVLTQGGTAIHDLLITRRSESWEGTCEVLGFVPGAGTELLAPSPLPARKLMFIGDSITCGMMADYRPDDPLNGTCKNHENSAGAGQTFGKILAKRLNAQCHLVSYGGRGVIRDWQGNTSINNAPVFYPRTLPDEASPLWNPAEYQPDSILICLGTNDFNQGVPDEQVFVKAYVDFVRRIRQDYPAAHIFIADSPMLWDAPEKVPKRTVLHAYILETIEKLADAQVQLAPIGHYQGMPNDGHPLAKDHVAIADELEPLLKRTLGW